MTPILALPCRRELPIIHTSGKPNLERTIAATYGKATVGVLASWMMTTIACGASTWPALTLSETDAMISNVCFCGPTPLSEFSQILATRTYRRFEAREGCTVGEASVTRHYPLGDFGFCPPSTVGDSTSSGQLSVARFLPCSSWALDEDALWSTTLANGCPLDKAGFESRVATGEPNSIPGTCATGTTLWTFLRLGSTKYWVEYLVWGQNKLAAFCARLWIELPCNCLW